MIENAYFYIKRVFNQAVLLELHNDKTLIL